MKAKQWEQQAIDACIRGAESGLEGEWSTGTVTRLLQHVLFLQKKIDAVIELIQKDK
jgi:hypothetical protein